MRKVIVRYRLKADRVDEHLALVRAVFEELAHTRSRDIRYAALRAKDGVSFTHIASFDTDANPLSALASFQAFQRGISDRCEQAPETVDVDLVGDYNFHG